VNFCNFIYFIILYFIFFPFFLRRSPRRPIPYRPAHRARIPWSWINIFVFYYRLAAYIGRKDCPYLPTSSTLLSYYRISYSTSSMGISAFILVVVAFLSCGILCVPLPSPCQQAVSSLTHAELLDFAHTLPHKLRLPIAVPSAAV